MHSHSTDRSRLAKSYHRHEIVEIQWVDSISVGASDVWHAHEDFLSNKSQSMDLQFSIGYLLFETKDRVGLVASIAYSDGCDEIAEVSGTITIPKLAIVGRRVLSKGAR